jgi:hypothetical protein
MRPEYDLRGGIRGKYYERYKHGKRVVLVGGEVAQAELSDEHMAELERRCREHVERPDSAIPWEEVRRKLIETEKAARDQPASFVCCVRDAAN